MEASVGTVREGNGAEDRCRIGQWAGRWCGQCARGGLLAIGLFASRNTDGMTIDSCILLSMFSFLSPSSLSSFPSSLAWQTRAKLYSFLICITPRLRKVRDETDNNSSVSISFFSSWFSIYHSSSILPSSPSLFLSSFFVSSATHVYA